MFSVQHDNRNILLLDLFRLFFFKQYFCARLLFLQGDRMLNKKLISQPPNKSTEEAGKCIKSDYNSFMADISSLMVTKKSLASTERDGIQSSSNKFPCI